MNKQREENGACSSYPESRKNSNEVQIKFCQSCGMPLTDDVLGTNSDGSKNEDYCMYCYRNGKFLQDCTGAPGFFRGTPLRPSIATHRTGKTTALIQRFCILCRRRKSDLTLHAALT